MNENDQYLILSAIGPDHSGAISHISKLCSKLSCHIIEGKSQRLGLEQSLFMAVRGSWHSIAKLEAQLPLLEKKIHLCFQSKRTDYPLDPPKGIPYQVSITAEDRAGILSELCLFFTKHNIHIDESTSETYTSSRSETVMCSLQMNVRLPIKSHLATLRDKFISYCEDRNLDAYFEPIKTQN